MRLIISTFRMVFFTTMALMLSISVGEHWAYGATYVSDADAAESAQSITTRTYTLEIGGDDLVATLSGLSYEECISAARSLRRLRFTGADENISPDDLLCSSEDGGGFYPLYLR